MPDSCNIARHLPSMAASQPDRTAIKIPRGRDKEGHIDYLSLSFAELGTEASAWRDKLLSSGIRRGDRTLVMVKPGLPLIAAVFGLFSIGAVPVVIDPGMGLRSFLSCVRRSRPRALVGIPLARVISRLAFTSFKGLEIRVPATSSLDARLSKPDAPAKVLETAPCEATELAAILFTSGSTGAPKGVCYEHGMFEAQVSMIRRTYNIQPGEIDLPMLPIFALFNPALGMTTVVPEIDPKHPARLDPVKIVQAIQQEKVTNSFGSPTLWGIVAKHCLEKGIELPGMKRVLCAGAPVPSSLWEESRRFLTRGGLHSPYGATECLPISSVSADKVNHLSLHGTHVGHPVGGMEVRVIAIQDSTLDSIEKAPALPTGEIGEIIVRGPVVTKSYDALPEATASAKIPDPRGGVWHRMGDTGFIDEQGDLWFCGRKAERVITPTATLYTEPCERVFRRHTRAKRCALVGIDSPAGKKPALVVEAKIEGAEEARNLALELRELGKAQPQTSAIRHFLFHPQFPVDVRHNAKIHRLTLARWAAEQKAIEIN